MSRTDFVSFLVDETIKLQQSGQVALSSLELKLKDYGLSFLKGEFLPQTQVLRFITPLGLLDLPINWSIFATDSVVSRDVILTRENDPDYLFNLLKTTWLPGLSRLLITHSDGFCYFVGLCDGDESYLHDILNPQEWLKTA